MEIVVSKKTGTYADPLCAIGFASLFEELTGKPVMILDRGADYKVSTTEGVSPENWSNPAPGFLYIWRRSKEPMPSAGEVLDYEQEQIIRDSVKKAATASRAAKAKVRDALAEMNEQSEVRNHPEFTLAALIESMRKGWMSDKALHQWILDKPAETLDVVRSQFSSTPGEIKCKWSNSQILNPSTGKGVHASKTVAKARAPLH